MRNELEILSLEFRFLLDSSFGFVIRKSLQMDFKSIIIDSGLQIQNSKLSKFKPYKQPPMIFAVLVNAVVLLFDFGLL